MMDLVGDVRRAVRGLLNRPALLLAAVISIGVAVGTNALLFGVVDTLLLRPPAHVTRPNQIVRLYYSDAAAPTASPWTSFVTYQQLHGRIKGLSDISALSDKMLVIGRGADAREVTAQFVTGNFFSLLGVAPARGRFFTANEDASSPLVIGYGLWRGEFAGAADIVGRSVYIGNRSFTVVGVAPNGFTGVNQTRVDVWLPIGTASQMVDSAALTSPTLYWVTLIGRLSDSSADQVGDQATAVLRSVQPLGAPKDDVRVVLGPIQAERGPARSSQGRLSMWLVAASVMLLLLACANVANLMLVRLLNRIQEMATRVALGATKATLIRYVGLDVGIVAVLGGLIAVLLVEWAGGAARTLLVPGLELSQAAFDVRTLGQIGAFTMAAAMLYALPSVVFVATRSFDLNSGAQSTGRSPFQRAVGAGLVVCQCAISVVLLVGAGLFARSFRNVSSIDLGIDGERLIYASADLRVGLSRPDALAFYEDLSVRVPAIPGVEKATVAMGLPLRVVWAVAVALPGDVWMGPNPVVLGHGVRSDYFDVTRLRITRGRAFEPSDSRAAVINEAFARAFWPRRDPIGACLRLGDDTSCTRVVGVAANTPRWSITEEREYELYIPVDHRPKGHGAKETLGLAVRAGRDPDGLILPIRKIIQSASPYVAFAPVTTFASILSPQLQPWRTATAVFSSFALVAVLLAGVGLYGLLAFIVSRLIRGIGVRMALGASPSMVRRSVVVQGCRFCGIGICLGVLAGALLAPAGASFLYGVSARDPVVFVLSAVVVGVTSIGASVLPAQRAAKVDVASLLRTD